MRQYQIAVVVGSLRRDSFNRKLAESGAHASETLLKAMLESIAR